MSATIAARQSPISHSASQRPSPGVTSRRGPLAYQAPVASLVACRLDPDLRSRLGAAVPDAVVAPSLEGLRQLVAGGRVSLIIADPATDGGRCADFMYQCRAEFPSVLIAAYTRLTADVVQSLVRLARAGVGDVVLYGNDDTPARFAELRERGAANPLAQAVIRSLHDRLGEAPQTLSDAMALMFRSPRRFRTTDDLAAAALTTRRSLHRQLAAAGFGSPRWLIASARVVRAIAMLREPGRRVRDVAATLGYSKPEQLSAQVRYLTGLNVRDLRDGPLPADIVASMLARLTAP